MPTRLLLLACPLLLAAPALAQVAPDSLREYELGEVVVGDARERRAPVSTVERIPLAAVERLDASSVAEVGRLVPAAFVQTNSRGETLLYLRGAGERQVALFFDGALLNVPWDNRVDLSMVPAHVVGGVTVAKGVPSVLWGANVLGGAVNVVSRGLEGEGALTEASLQGGAPALGQAALAHLGRRGRWSYAGALGHTAREGFAVPGDREAAGLAFSQDEGRTRTNTDARLTSGFARLAYEAGPRTKVGLAALVLEGEKGVAPESHLDPAAARVRFWRYPSWRTAMLILSGETAREGASARGAIWASRFAQEIASYTDAAYDVRNSEQEDEDLTLGGRLVLERALRPLTLRLALNALISEHRQQDADVEEGQRVPEPRLTYRQGLYSAGLEAESRPAEHLRITLGASLDALATPATGDKPPRDALADYGLTAGAAYDLRPGWALHAAIGRKTRFPTLRELFGEALDRFALNPDLRPESSLLAEAGVRHHGTHLSAEAVLFLNRTRDAIDQERLPDGRRRRVNLEGSRVLGLEVAGAARPTPLLILDGHLTLMRARALDEEGGEGPLSERPEVLGRLAATYNPASGLTAQLEGVVTGKAYSPSGPGAFARLPASSVLNVRLGYRIFAARPRPLSVEFFARVNNVADAVVLPQPGLPAPGRELQAGLKLAL